MAYQVLARKYRPQRFADVIGQDHVTQTLLNALAQDRIAHGYIFSGHRGIGKTTIARILAMALQCRTPQGTPERPTPEPCGVCDACTEIRAGNAMDVIEIDAATNRGIDEIRELREGARYSPARDKYKIYILDEAHQITDAAFNALLKTLEEPPAHVIFMMATTQPEDIPQTIRSRSQHFSFHAVRFQEIVAQLRSIAEKESVGVDEAALSLLAEAGDGSMRDALSIMDQAIASAPLVKGAHTLEASQIRSLMGTVSNQVFENMMKAVKEQNAASMLEQAAELLDAGNSPQQIARQMVRFLRNCLMARLAGTNSDLLQVSDEERARAERVAAAFSEEDLTRFLNSMLRTFDDLGYRQEQRFHLELGLLKLVHMQRLLPLEDLFRQLSLPTGAGSGSTSATPRLSGTGATPKQLESAARETSAVRSPVREEFKQPAPPLNETAAPVTAESHPLQGIFGGSPGSAAVAVSKSAPLASEPKPQPERVSSPPQERVAAATIEAEPTIPAAVAAPASVSAAAEPEPPPVEAASSSVEIPPAGSQAESPQADSSPDVEVLRAAMSRALTQGGHETAGYMLDSGTCEWNGNELRVRVAASKTMFGMMYPAAAQQLVKDAFRQTAGPGQTIRLEPGDPVVANGKKPQAKVNLALPADGAARPQDHPLIRHAQQLFSAEVRSVVSLRDPQASKT
ncbi:MAG TPA: DNA polymerase III subunit gamma/tau [Acidobacteriaceae bacterium]|nr:DNA polymerase III subunit gamma/tau [Acidobacteriaceae bacterium]